MKYFFRLATIVCFIVFDFVFLIHLATGKGTHPGRKKRCAKIHNIFHSRKRTDEKLIRTDEKLIQLFVIHIDLQQYTKTHSTFRLTAEKGAKTS